MKPVYLVGRALASALGLNLKRAIVQVQTGTPPLAHDYALPGLPAMPYRRITDDLASPKGPDGAWNARAKALIVQVAADAGAALARDGVLFIATSCLDGATAEAGQGDMDFHRLSARIAQWLEWRGPVYLISTACTSSLQALLCAQEWLRAGLAEQALVLGFELDNRLTVPGFAALQLLSASRSQPFSAQRDGLVLGEAVAALRLSSEPCAGWQLLGGANVVDGLQPTGASATAVTRMCQQALGNCALSHAKVDLIKVQAAGSPGNDAIEAQGLHEAFAQMPALVSLKPWLGHCMGASGAAELALLLECLECDAWPAQAGDCEAALAVQFAQQAPVAVRVLLAAILGFGGSHTAVVLKR